MPPERELGRTTNAGEGVVEGGGGRLGPFAPRLKALPPRATGRQAGCRDRGGASLSPLHLLRNQLIPPIAQPAFAYIYTARTAAHAQLLTIARPSVRPAHQRTPRPLPEPVFPQTPPDSATLESAARLTSDDWEKTLFDSATPTRPEFTLPPLPTEVKTDHATKPSRPAFLDSPPPPSPSAHHLRSRSFSTADGHTTSSHSVEPGTFKVVIDRSARPKTADTDTYPILQVPIPSYRLGTPRFSARGTAILRSSVYTNTAASEDCRSSFLAPQRATHSFLSSRTRSDLYSPSTFNFRATMDLKPPLPSPGPSPARISKLPIGPHIYDALTTNPDDNAVVRFSPTGDILAATPSRLIAHITSPSFLDYELLSDFFLTYRTFLMPRELVAYLLSRLRWAVNRQDDFGRIVRVRTFVALRHWILNYFIDDYVPEYRLRVYFCELVNSLYKDLSARADGGGGDIKIIGELKKCWRRTCALYWDNEDRNGMYGADEDLLPGGKPDSLAPVDESAVPLVLPSTPPRESIHRQVSDHKTETIGSNPSDQFASRHMDWAHRARHTPQNSLSSPYFPSQVDSGVRIPLSPDSERSLQVLSCSIPVRGLSRPEPAKDVPLYAYPVPHPVTANPPRLTSSPQPNTASKRPNKSSHGHKRSGSFSDALRDHRAHHSVSKSTTSDGEISTVDLTTISKIPGSLVRGGLFQPGSPYIDVKNGGLRHTRSRLELAHEDVVGPEVQFRGGYVANPGVKKLLGSVRRALSSRHPSAPSPQFAHGFQNHGSPSMRSSNPATLSNSPGVVVKRRNTRPRPQLRMDLLASAVGESFKQAVQEQMRGEEKQSPRPALGGFEFEFDKRKAQSSEDQTRSEKIKDLRLNSGITTGSKSILIMDDTGAPPLPVMSGALSHAYQGHDSVATVPIVVDRRPSIDATIEAEPLPISPTAQHREAELPEDWERLSRTSMQTSIISPRRSVSLGRERMHSFRRRGSAKVSMARTASLRRHTSHASGLGRHQVESMATFQTMSSDNDPFHLDRQPSGSALKPARQLRRRPGGDLRAADNVHDLESGQRPHSTGSVSNRTHSIANSVILRSDRFIGSMKAGDIETETESDDGRLKVERKQVSLVDTHSSQPNLRPSFEVEVAKLAALPDDIDDDGGIESALMKLEGRYEKKSPDLSESAPNTPSRTGVESGGFDARTPIASSSNPSYRPSTYEPSQSGNDANGDDVFYRPLAPPDAEGQVMYRLSGEAFKHRVPAVNSQIESEDSYSSLPLLDRGVSEITSSARARAPTLETMRSSAKPAPLNPLSPATRLGEQHSNFPTSSNSSSIEHITKTDSMNRIPRDGYVPRSSVARESFLLDDDEDLSDLEPARRTMSDDSHGVRSFFDDETPGETEKEFSPVHPLRHPPTPPLTANRLRDSAPKVDTTIFEKGLPTPGVTPTSRLDVHAFDALDKPSEPIHGTPEIKQDVASNDPPHLPFILAYDSETLAQQFTIIEKDALDEIDWRELIELRWKQSSPQISDWVHYLRTEEAKGVDVVIARFNLVVKWAVSEIVLTESIEERARCIVKYIHIATYTRRLRNYATMYQITIALMSADISRMRKTWSLVPPAELQTMRELEALVQPLKNFHNLRMEMETASVEEGCIPFIGKRLDSDGHTVH